jgi:hypothetical protein
MRVYRHAEHEKGQLKPPLLRFDSNSVRALPPKWLALAFRTPLDAL